MDKIDLTNKCYKSKEDKAKATIWWKGDLSQETAKEREERIKTIRENRGTWVYDETKKCMVRKEEYYENRPQVDVPSISLWQDEFAVVATGRRMSKRQLKQYCKENGKVWQN